MLYYLTSNLFVKVTAGKIVKGYIDHYVTSSLRYGSFNQGSTLLQAIFQTTRLKNNIKKYWVILEKKMMKYTKQ